MRMMERNKSKFFYALYKEKVPKTDEYGNVTGEYEIIRDNPVEFSANISAAKGETSTRQFGESESYDKVIVMGTDAPPIDEYTVLWVDKTPQVDETGALVTNDDGEVITPHDYIVKKVAKSLNSVSVAISKVSEIQRSIADYRKCLSMCSHPVSRRQGSNQVEFHAECFHRNQR